MRVTREDIEMYEMVVDKERYVMEIIEGFKRKGRLEYAEVEVWLRDDVRDKVKEILEEERRLVEERMLEQFREQLRGRVIESLRNPYMLGESSMSQVVKTIPKEICLDRVNIHSNNWNDWREFKRKL